MSISNMATHKGWYNTRRRTIRDLCRARGTELIDGSLLTAQVFDDCRALSRKQSRRLRQLQRQARQQD